jgi:hypothetical protein
MPARWTRPAGDCSTPPAPGRGPAAGAVRPAGRARTGAGDGDGRPAEHDQGAADRRRPRDGAWGGVPARAGPPRAGTRPRPADPHQSRCGPDRASRRHGRTTPNRHEISPFTRTRSTPSLHPPVNRGGSPTREDPGLTSRKFPPSSFPDTTSRSTSTATTSQEPTDGLPISFTSLNAQPETDMPDDPPNSTVGRATGTHDK